MGKRWLVSLFTLLSCSLCAQDTVLSEVKDTQEHLCHEDDFSFSLGIGPMLSSQLSQFSRAISAWEADGHINLLHYYSKNQKLHYNLGAEFGIDAPASGSHFLSKVIQPEIIGLKLRLEAKDENFGWMIGHHHDSIHGVSDLSARTNNRFRNEDDFGSTDIAYISKHFNTLYTKLTAGVGRMTSGTNVLSFAELPGFLMLPENTIGLFFNAKSEFDILETVNTKVNFLQGTKCQTSLLLGFDLVEDIYVPSHDDVLVGAGMQVKQMFRLGSTDMNLEIQGFQIFGQDPNSYDPGILGPTMIYVRVVFLSL